MIKMPTRADVEKRVVELTEGMPENLRAMILEANIEAYERFCVQFEALAYETCFESVDESTAKIKEMLGL